MSKALETIARQCSHSGTVQLTVQETVTYIPKLDAEIRRQRHRAHTTADFSVDQWGYNIRAKVQFFSGYYTTVIHEIVKIHERMAGSHYRRKS
jgi:hypothetical protein